MRWPNSAGPRGAEALAVPTDVTRREEVERLRLIKRLVEEFGINLAGVQRLLLIAEVVQRIRPLVDEGALTSGAGRRQLQMEMRRLTDAIGL